MRKTAKFRVSDKISEKQMQKHFANFNKTTQEELFCEYSLIVDSHSGKPSNKCFEVWRQDPKDIDGAIPTGKMLQRTQNGDYIVKKSPIYG